MTYSLTKSTCGYGTIHDVETRTLEDRQESFFLSETCKYLYLLFDTNNPVNTMSERYVFSTEGHVFPVMDEFRTKIWDFDEKIRKNPKNKSQEHCDFVKQKDIQFPLEQHYLSQIFSQIGAELS